MYVGERKIFISIFKLIVFAFWIVFQFIAVTLIYNVLNIFFIYYFAIFEVISAIAVIHLNYKYKSTSYKVSWISLILLIPIIGVIVYVISRIGANRNFSKINKIDHGEKLLDKEDKTMLESLKKRNKVRYNETRLIKNISGYTSYSDTEITYFPCGESMYEKLLCDLKSAEKFIFLEYFIISKGQMWNEILDILIQKSQQGVEIRILVDYVGSMFVLPKDFRRILKQNNIKFKIFNPIKLILNFMLNYRDHRKIIVIDGKSAFTGGINIGDEYINLYEKYGYWKDMAVRIEGNAVYSFTVMFLKMWESITKRKEYFKKYSSSFPAKNTGGIVIPYSSGPEQIESTAENIYLNIINSAKNYVYITTPYLIIDYDMMLSLSLAAKRGVDVRIITPFIPDKRVIQILTRSHYDTLLDSGVKIYEYTPGFIHGKTFVSDDECAIVGTINLDYRSLFLHFECAVYIYNMPVVHQIKDDFVNTLSKSQKINKIAWKKRGFSKKILESILRLFGPLV